MSFRFSSAQGRCALFQVQHGLRREVPAESAACNKTSMLTEAFEGNARLHYHGGGRLEPSHDGVKGAGMKANAGNEGTEQ